MTEQREELELEIRALTPRLAAQLPHLRTMLQHLATHAAVTRHDDPEFEGARKNILHILEGLIRFSQTNVHNAQVLYKLRPDVESLVRLMKEEMRELVQLHAVVSRFTFQNSRKDLPEISGILTNLEKVYIAETKIVQTFGQIKKAA